MVSEQERAAWRLIVRTFILILGTILFAFLAIQIRGILILILIAAVLATSINPLATLVNSRPFPGMRWRVPKVVVVLLIYLGLLVLVTLAGIFFIPPLIEQGQALLGSLPQLIQQLADIQGSIRERFPMLPEIRITIEDLQPLLVGLFRDPSQVLGFAFSIVDIIGSIVIVLTLVVYFVMFGDSITEFIVSFLPPQHRERGRQTAAQIGNRLGLWLGGQILISFTIFAGVLIALLIIGIPFPVPLALAAGLAEFIPYMGPVIGYIPTAIVAAFVSPIAFIAVTVFYIALQWVESNVLSPMIMSRVMHMPPVVVLLALLIGGSLLGLVGALIAVPVAAGVVVIYTTLRTADLVTSPRIIIPPGESSTQESKIDKID